MEGPIGCMLSSKLPLEFHRITMDIWMIPQYFLPVSIWKEQNTALPDVIHWWVVDLPCGVEQLLIVSWSLLFVCLFVLVFNDALVLILLLGMDLEVVRIRQVAHSCYCIIVYITMNDAVKRDETKDVSFHGRHCICGIIQGVTSTGTKIEILKQVAQVKPDAVHHRQWHCLGMFVSVSGGCVLKMVAIGPVVRLWEDNCWSQLIVINSTFFGDARFFLTSAGR